MLKKSFIIYFFALILVNFLMPFLTNEPQLLVHLIIKFVLFILTYYCYSTIQAFSQHPDLIINIKSRSKRSMIWKAIILSGVFSIFCVIIIFNLAITTIFLAMILDLCITNRLWSENLYKSLIAQIINAAILVNLFVIKKFAFLTFLKEKLKKQTNLSQFIIKPQSVVQLQLLKIAYGDAIDL